jgi:hypothetical protein
MKKDIIGTTSRQPISAFLVTAASSLAISLPAAAQPISLGRLQTGAAITFTRTASGGWGIKVAGGLAPRIAQPKPAAIEIYRADDDIREPRLSLYFSPLSRPCPYGWRVSGDAIHKTAKERVLAGTLTPKQAVALVVERTLREQDEIAVTE